MENSTQVNPYNEHCVRLAISVCKRKAAVQCCVANAWIEKCVKLYAEYNKT